MPSVAWPSPGPDDYRAVEKLLGRKPVGLFAVVARRGSLAGEPAVIACWPIIADIKPMPTLFWLVDPELNHKVSQLESGGVIAKARAGVDQAKLAEAHDRYRRLRDDLIPEDYRGPRPSGGIGGTASGVKCIHSHVAFEVVGGGDPVVEWLNAEVGAAIDSQGLFLCGFPPGLEIVNSRQS